MYQVNLLISKIRYICNYTLPLSIVSYLWILICFIPFIFSFEILHNAKQVMIQNICVITFFTFFLDNIENQLSSL